MATKRNTKSSENFFRKNIYYILLFICLAAIAAIITLAVVMDSRPTPGIVDPDPVDPTDNLPVTMMLPVTGEYTLHGRFTGDDDLIWSSVNKQYEPHLGIDFIVEAGSDVVSVLDGTVISVVTDNYEGLVVTVKHSDTLTTVYKALDPSEVKVTQGQNVKRGDVIGVVAPKTYYEISTGAHVHFEVLEGGVEVDPMDYLTQLDSSK